MSPPMFARISRVHDPLDRLELLRRDGCVCEKSKRRRSGATSEPFCDHVRAEHLAQRRVQQVRRGMVEHGRLARRGIDGAVTMSPLRKRRPRTSCTRRCARSSART